MQVSVRAGAVAALVTIELSVAVILFDFTDIGTRFPSLPINSWILVLVFALPYFLYDVGFAFVGLGFAALGAQYSVASLRNAGYAIAAAYLANDILGLPLIYEHVPQSITWVLRAAALGYAAYGLFELRRSIGAIAAWTSLAAAVAALAMLFNEADFPNLILLILAFFLLR